MAYAAIGPKLRTLPLVQRLIFNKRAFSVLAVQSA
jgi:hypothetical protein